MAFSEFGTVFVDGVTPVPAAFLNKIRTELPSALDADGGGDYANTVLIKFTSGAVGWEFDCPVTIGADGTLSIDGGAAEIASGSTLTVQSGAFLTVDSGGTWTLAGAGEVASGATLTVQSGGFLTVDSGGTVTFLSGADMAVDSGATVTLAGTETVTGTMHFTSAGTWIMEGTGNITSTSIVTVDVAGKLDIGFGGFLRHQSSGTISHASGSTETHASGSTDTYSSGSTTTWNSGSTVADGSTRTRTGPVILSGAGATTQTRIDVDLAKTTSTFDPTDFDEMYYAAAGPITLTLSAPKAGNMSPFNVANVPASAGAITVIDGTTASTLLVLATSKVARIRWDGTDYQALSVLTLG